MSLSYERLPSIVVKDPRVILDNQRVYAILKSGSQLTCKPYTTTSISNSSIQFSTPPPSGGIIVDRKIFLVLPVRLTFTGTAPVGQVLLNPGQDAPRAYPISSSIETLQATINNQSVSINIADIVHAMLRYNTPEKVSNTEFSMTPTLLDQSQAYSQLFGSNRNPLGFYGDSHDQSMNGRGGFPFTIVSNTQTSAIVDMVVCEPLFLSPFYFGCGNESGFFNVTTLDFNITFLGNTGNRMWSHDAVSTGVATTISSISHQFSNFTGPAFTYSDIQPLMLFKFITPQETDYIPRNMPITYPYFDVSRYPTDLNAGVAAGGATTLQSNNIQLNSIPRRIYLFVRERNSDLYSSPNNPDSFFSIEGVSLQWQNKNGILASSTKYDLFNICTKNQCNLSWEQWSGENLYRDGSFSNTINGVGSVLCLEFGTDIGLDSLEAPGKLGQYQLQVNIDVINRSNRTISPTFYIVSVAEGTFTIEGYGKSSTNIGVISSEDILNASQNEFINYQDVEEVQGGNFWTSLKNFGRNLLSGLRGTKAISRGLSSVAKLPTPFSPIAEIGSDVAKVLGFGYDMDDADDDVEGGVLVGGRRLSRSRLRKRKY